MAQLGARLAPPKNFQVNSLFFRGFRLARIDEGRQLECRGRGLDITGGSAGLPAKPYEFIVVVVLPDDGKDLVLKSFTKVPLAVDAGRGRAWVFPRDPASCGEVQGLRDRRPTRDEAILEPYRADERIASVVNVPLDAPALQVLQSRFVIDDDPNAGVKQVRLPATGAEVRPPIRSNILTAISAFYNFREVFACFDRYKIKPAVYFRFADLPLQVAYRSGIRPGPGRDGLTVNARVLPEGWEVDDVGPQPGKPRLGVHLALANLSRRERAPWNRRDRSPVEYLGIAADPRWIWHEVGHILLMASVGELEFRFAHSAGDALAAIVADPASKLATDDDTARGATFPWVSLTRRHDRCVSKGWSWSGSQHRALRRLPDARRLRHKGYWSEQNSVVLPLPAVSVPWRRHE